MLKIEGENVLTFRQNEADDVFLSVRSKADRQVTQSNGVFRSIDHDSQQNNLSGRRFSLLKQGTMSLLEQSKLNNVDYLRNNKSELEFNVSKEKPQRSTQDGGGTPDDFNLGLDLPGSVNQQVSNIDLFSLRILSLLVCRGTIREKARFLVDFTL